ncbi:MAG: T9SS type A sorting domain-containing protein [Rhodothermales bacterium]
MASLRLQFAFLILLFPFLNPAAGQDRTDLPNPILFVTHLPMPTEWMMFSQSFGNHLGNVSNAGRGGDLWIYYPAQDSLKNLTALAGFGTEGFQGATSIAVRDPQVHRDGAKAVFSMAVGATEQQYQHVAYYWQLYEVTGLGIDETPVITRVPNQPADYNNIAPFYGTDDRILFTSDRPRNGERHLYPQRDEYESAPTVTGIWSLDPASGDLFLMNHAPSGSFTPFIDRFGRVLSTRWDHLQRDQQNYPGSSSGAYNWTDESPSSSKTSSNDEVYPEPRERVGDVNGHTIELFLPWQINEDGTGEEVLNHLGRHELVGYFEQSFLDDSALDAFIPNRPNSIPIRNLFQLAENPQVPGEYVGIDAPTFYQHTSGPIVRLYAPPGMNPDSIRVERLTADEYADGHYRHPRPLSNGWMIASHTDYAGASDNLGSRTQPESPFRFRLRVLQQSGSTLTPGAFITEGIHKAVSYWDPDEMVTYSAEVPMWEFSPVEVAARPRPARTAGVIEAPEQQIFDEEGVDVDRLKRFLKENDLALVVSRNVTKRDAADTQQPYNLRVAGTSTETTGSGGKMYDISHLQIFQGDQLRGYEASPGGRRVIAQPMHDAASNPDTSGPAGSVEIAGDGSVAAFVPARRALSWQLVDEQALPVVRERYWLSLQPGEIRSCSGCHGANTVTQDGSLPPVNPPEALRNLMRFYLEQPTAVEPVGVARDTELLGNYPNPFNPETVIRYRTDKAGPVLLAVYAVTGQEVARLVDGFQAAGEHAVPWKPAGAASGVYIYRLTTNDRTFAGKMVLAK